MRRTIFIACLLPLVLFGCETFDNGDGTFDLTAIDDIQYDRHVQPLLNMRCVACHEGADAAAGLRLDAWDALFAGSAFGEAIIPFDAARSRLIQLARAETPHPLALGADTLTAEEVTFLARWIDEGARSADGAVPFDDDGPRLYVANQNSATVSVIDLTAKVVIRTIDLVALGFAETAKPHHVAVEPGGSRWYVSLIGANRVLQFNRANELIGMADFETPGMLAIHPTEDLLFVGRSLSAVSPPASIGVITRSDMSMEEVEVVFPRPHALAVSGDGAYVITASLGVNRLMTVHLPDGQVDFTTVEGPLHAFVQHAIAPPGTPGAGLMYSSAQLTSEMRVFDVTDPEAITTVATIPVNAAPWHPVFTPDGGFVFVGNKDANTVTVLDAATHTVAAVIAGDGLAEPHGAAVSPDGRFVYISNRNTKAEYTPRHDLGKPDTGTVVVLHVATGEIVKVIEVGRFAAGLGR